MKEHLFKYSPAFLKLIEPSLGLKDLLVSSSFGGNFEGWEKRKGFISRAIHKPGSFFDVGCGNGFLIRCLQEWSDYELIPYGIDINETFVKKARQLFSNYGYGSNFAVLDAKQVSKLTTSGLPNKFDFVYLSNDWTQYPMPDAKVLITNMLSLVKPGGRLIFGFYNEDKDKNLEATRKLQTGGIRFSDTLENPYGTNLISWINS